MSKHTPGPWHLRVSNNGTPVIEHGDCLLDEVGVPESRICAMPAEITMSFNSLANARLIAAAPELLDALITARDLLVLFAGQYPECNEAFKKAHEAIAKAAGD